MASMQIDVAAASSSPFSYVSLRDQPKMMGYVNSQCIRTEKADDQDQDSSWLPNSKTDDSWLPTTSQNSTVTSPESKADRNRKVENDVVDNSWLPTVNDGNGKRGTNTNESENDVDYSWLPATFIDNNKSLQKNDKAKSKSASSNKNIEKNKSNSNSNSNSNKSAQKETRNEHWALARKVVFESDQQNQNQNATIRKTTSDCSPLKQDSPSKPRYVVESPNSGGVSSLLQRWKDFAEVDNSKTSNKSPPSSGKSSGSTCSPPSTTTKDSEPNSESDKASRGRRLSCPLPTRDSKDSNPGGAEKEKNRVVDIIKKLSREEQLAANSHAGTQGNNLSLPPIRTTSHRKQTEGEHKGTKNVKVSRHLVRGRQAYNNFLMQMEHDKHLELKWLFDRKAVSKFSHRGRIKSLLRFKFLRLGVEPKQEPRRHESRVSKPLESNDHRLDIMDLRERFNSRNEKGAMESKKHRKNEENPASTSIIREVETKTKIKTTTSYKKPEPMTPNDQSTQHSNTSCKDVVRKAKFVDSFSSPMTSKEDRHYKDDNNYELYEDDGFMSAKGSNNSQMEDRGRRLQTFESFHDWTPSEYSQTRSELDESESYDTQVFDTEYDWISDISRPKSDWEDMRQARYQEMLHESSGNQDIQRLLERKSVSGFLGSTMRDLIDQLMVNRVQQSHVEVEKQDVVVRKKEQEDRSVLDEEEDCRSRTTDTKCSEYSGYANQRAYLERSWRPNDVFCNSETTTTTTTSPSTERTPSTNRSHNNSTPQSSTAMVTHQPIEMGLIYDLKGHMEQLHNEIMELRKSIKGCVNMQVKLQHCFKQNVVEAATSSGIRSYQCLVFVNFFRLYIVFRYIMIVAADQRKETKPPGIAKLNCSICYDTHVDSLLYRCGHMCTCFKCALELQRLGGECPICEAPIVDVVRAMCS
ncbi:hypothetical protein SSX86_019559 [Deinandra increscens subsp. villosa]|uniref:RING-type domain-containing protein n=1 Tax=Deinandra increscens subsp. villosa TaxID=3103831 RepID=A0AAP0CXD6_9ASTR